LAYAQVPTPEGVLVPEKAGQIYRAVRKSEELVRAALWCRDVDIGDQCGGTQVDVFHN
jgi:hypothetical protein